MKDIFLRIITQQIRLFNILEETPPLFFGFPPAAFAILFSVSCTYVRLAAGSQFLYCDPAALLIALCIKLYDRLDCCCLPGIGNSAVAGPVGWRVICCDRLTRIKERLMPRNIFLAGLFRVAPQETSAGIGFFFDFVERFLIFKIFHCCFLLCFHLMAHV